MKRIIDSRLTIKCLLGFHKNKDIKTQITKGICYGYGGGSPGMRVAKKCALCDHISYQKLNLCVPYKDLINDKLWS